MHFSKMILVDDHCRMLGSMATDATECAHVPRHPEDPDMDIRGITRGGVGASAVGFPKQYQLLGLKASLPLLASGTTFDEFTLPTLGDEAIGNPSPHMYSAALVTPANTTFVQAY